MYGIITENQAAALAACLPERLQFVRLLFHLLPYARKAEDLKSKRDRVNAADAISRNAYNPEAVRFVSMSYAQAGALLGKDASTARHHLRHLEECGALVRVADGNGTCATLYALAVPAASLSDSPNDNDTLAKQREARSGVQGVKSEVLVCQTGSASVSDSPNGNDTTNINQIFTNDAASAPGLNGQPEPLPPEVPAPRFTMEQWENMTEQCRRITVRFHPHMVPEALKGGDPA